MTKNTLKYHGVAWALNYSKSRTLLEQKVSIVTSTKRVSKSL